MLRTTVLFFCYCLFYFPMHAQDSTKVFSCEDLFSMILENHPVAKQAALLPQSAKEELRSVRGAFDPKINSELYQKKYDAKEYYTIWDSYLKLPTWYGVDIKAGYENNSGLFLNQEHQTPLQGLAYVGLSLPIGQGLLIDERRAQLRQAQQLPKIAEAEKVKVINKLLLQASKDYWDWMYYYHKFQLYRKGYDMAQVRYEAVKERVTWGDLAYIDTVEAAMQMQNLQILLNLSEVEYQNASLILSNYLWSPEGEPLQITSQLIPGAELESSHFITETVESLIQKARRNHPDIIKLHAKMNQLEIEKRFRADKFKPKLSLEYNVLQAGFPANGEAFHSSYLSNNYKIGATLNYPLFMRYERSKYQLTKLKIQETHYEIKQMNREIENNIQASANEWQALEKQIRLQENLVKHSEALRAGEQIRFENGESSLFLINARETTLLGHQIKLYEMKSKFAKSRIMIEWAAGTVQVN